MSAPAPKSVAKKMIKTRNPPEPLVVSVATATEPLTSVFLSIPLFGLKLTLLEMVGIVMVIVSVILLSKSEQA